MSIRDELNRIREELIGTQEKNVFLVEGSDDRESFRILLERFLPGWEQRWAIAEAGNKRRLLELLRKEPGWLGLADRDEWGPSEIDEHQARHPNLLVLPRFCLESYLINPVELWLAVPPARQAEVAGGRDEFEARIHAGLPRHLRHGALFKVVTPLWSGLRALGFKEALASQDSLTTAQDDAEIQRILGEWDTLLDPGRVFSDFKAELLNAKSASIAEQFSIWVHGKVFWKNVVNPSMNDMFGQMEEGERRRKILRKLPQPEDLKPILDHLR